LAAAQEEAKGIIKQANKAAFELVQNKNTVMREIQDAKNELNRLQSEEKKLRDRYKQAFGE
jgi:hypothetical protein